VLHIREELSVRIKRMDDEEGGSWQQVRAYLDTSAGYVHEVGKGSIERGSSPQHADTRPWSIAGDGGATPPARHRPFAGGNTLSGALSGPHSN
jgi:hypothetical protein